MKKLNEITEVRIPVDFDEVVDALCGADGYVERVVLYCSRDLCTVLEEMKFANRNIKGSYGYGTAMKKLYKTEGFDAVFNAVVAFCRENNIKVLKERVVYYYDEVK